MSGRWSSRFFVLGASILALLAPIYNAHPAGRNRAVLVRNSDIVKLGRVGGRVLYCEVNSNPHKIGTVRRDRGKKYFTKAAAADFPGGQLRQKFKAFKRTCLDYQRPTNEPESTATPTRTPTVTPTRTPTATPTFTPHPCLPQLSGSRIEIRENSDVVFALNPSFQCPQPDIRFEIASQPQHGTLNIEGHEAHYSGAFFDGTDHFSLRVCVPSRGECSAAAQFTVDLIQTELSGRPYELAPYRDNLSELEVRHLLNKVALGACPALVRFGVLHGLTELVDHMLEDENGGCTYSLPIMSGGYVNPPGSNPVDPNNTNADAFAYWMAHPHHWTSAESPDGLSIQHWRSDLLYRETMVNLRYGNPLREYMWSMVWDPQFATNVLEDRNGGIHDAKLHYNVLSSNALGYFEDFFRDFYGPLELPTDPSVVRVPGVDPNLAYNPDRNTSIGTEIYSMSGPYRAHGLKHFHGYLNNETNAEPDDSMPLQRLNENLGRESLELHTMGIADLVSGARNYDEDDVLSSTRALSGYAYDYDGNQNADGNFQTSLTARAADDAGPWRFWLSFFGGRSAGARDIATELFSGSSFQRTAAWQSYDWSTSGLADNIFVYILRTHPASSRRLAARLFATLIGPDLLNDRSAAEQIVSQLSAELRRVDQIYDPVRNETRSASFNIKRVLRILLRSQAMFARRDGGYQSPLEHIISALRRLDIKLTNQNVPDVIIDELSRAGQVPMSPPSVFAWPSSGTPSTGYFHDGNAWLDTTPLLSVHRTLLRIFSTIFHSTAAPGPIGEVLFPNGWSSCNWVDTPDDGSGCPGASEVVEFVLGKYNLAGNDQNGDPLISAEERQVLIEYLDRPGSPWPREDLWQWGYQINGGLAVRRAVGLFYLVATHPLNFRK